MVWTHAEYRQWLFYRMDGGEKLSQRYYRERIELRKLQIKLSTCMGDCGGEHLVNFLTFLRIFLPILLQKFECHSHRTHCNLNMLRIKMQKYEPV